MRNPYRFALILSISAFSGTAASLRGAEEIPATPPAVAIPAATPDFTNSGSEALTSKAWDAYNAKNFPLAKAYAQKCVDLYLDKAVEMQKGMTAAATEKEEVFKSWAVNDVGTCQFILGQTLEAEGKPAEAIAPYKFLVEKLSFAQCWDAKGWFWKPADAAKERIKVLEFDALK